MLGTIWYCFLLFTGFMSPTKHSDTTTRIPENNRTIGFLGPEGTYSQVAAETYFPVSGNFKFIPCPTINAVFQSVVNNDTVFGIVPFKNTIGGIVNQTITNLANEPSIFVTGALDLNISHNLAWKPREQNDSSSLSSIKKVYSHPQALAQCRKFLLAHCPGAIKIPVASTAMAAQMAKDDPESAAISSISACTKYGLQILKSNVQDEKNNTTTFFVIRRSVESDLKIPTTNVIANYHNYNTLISFRVDNLYEKFAESNAIFDKLNNITLISVDNFPNQNSSSAYNFLVQVEGHPNHQPLKSAWKNLKSVTIFHRIVGYFRTRQHK